MDMKLAENIKIVYYNIIFTYKIHIKWLPKKNAVLENIIMPIIQGIFYILVADYISSGDIIYYITGSLCFTAVNASMSTVSVMISAERRFGTLSATIGSVYHSFFLFLGRILYSCGVGYVRFLATYLALFAIFIPDQMKWKGFLQYTVIYLLLCISLGGIGYFIGIIGMVKRNMMGINSIISRLLLLMSGVYFSIHTLPVWVRWCSYLSPLYYGIELSRNIVVYGNYEHVLLDVSMMMLLGVGYMLAGVFYFQKIERQILRDNQLDMF